MISPPSRPETTVSSIAPGRWPAAAPLLRPLTLWRSTRRAWWKRMSGPMPERLCRVSPAGRTRRPGPLPPLPPARTRLFLRPILRRELSPAHPPARTHPFRLPTPSPLREPIRPRIPAPILRFHRRILLPLHQPLPGPIPPPQHPPALPPEPIRLFLQPI